MQVMQVNVEEKEDESKKIEIKYEVKKDIEQKIDHKLDNKPSNLIQNNVNPGQTKTNIDPKSTNMFGNTGNNKK